MNIYTPHLIYYVYAYLRSDGTPYYIGKGKDKRAWDKNHTVSLPNDNTRIIIIEANLTEIGAFALERRLIRWYGRKDIGTGILRNRTDGGEGGSGYKHTEYNIQKISAANKGRIHSVESRLKMSEAKKGHILSEEHKLKLSETLKGRIISPETKLKMSESSKGRVFSEEHKLKLSEAQKDRIFSPLSGEHKRKISASNKGRIRSEETRNKLSEALKGRKLSPEHKLKLSVAAKTRYQS